MKRQITEYLDIDLLSEMWCCHNCGRELISAREPYKKGCLVAERDPREIHNPHIEGTQFTFAPDPEWCRLIEFYCPECGVMVETEYLPPGHPITHDIELDVDKLKARYLGATATVSASDQPAADVGQLGSPPGGSGAPAGAAAGAAARAEGDAAP